MDEAPNESESDPTGAIRVLDVAYERLARWGFDEPNGFVNHAPMVCEALVALGRSDEVESWSQLDAGSDPLVPAAPRAGFSWESARGDGRRASEWLGFFDRVIPTEGWSVVLGEWLPRLLPGMHVALFHAAIRTAHAVRAVAVADTAARRAELARGLAYWAALWQPGPPPAMDAARGSADPRLAIVHAAAGGAGQYLAKPNIFHLHGVTAAMAVAILVEHADDTAAAAALGQVVSEHAALYGTTQPLTPRAPSVDDATLITAAVTSGDAHAVKLVEACRRGLAVTGDLVFRAAAERGARRGLRAMEGGRPS